MDQLVLLKNAKILSEKMLIAAQAKQWDVAQELERQRRPMLDQAFVVMPHDASMSLIQAQISEIITLNEQIAELGDAAAVLLVINLKELHQGQSAARAYGDCAKTK